MENNDTPYHEAALGVASMMKKRFLREVMNISIPVALQSMLQSSFSMIDQVMAGQPVDQSAAAVEIASRPGFIYAFLVSAISTIAAIMTSQYIGKNNREAESWVFVKMHIRNCYVIELVISLTDAGFDDVELCKCLSIIISAAGCRTTCKESRWMSSKNEERQGLFNDCLSYSWSRF